MDDLVDGGDAGAARVNAGVSRPTDPDREQGDGADDHIAVEPVADTLAVAVAEMLAPLTSAVDDLVAGDPITLSDTDLLRCLDAMEGRRLRLQAAVTGLVGEVHTRELAGRAGFRSTGGLLRSRLRWPARVGNRRAAPLEQQRRRCLRPAPSSRPTTRTSAS
ncbi:MAG: hypothetical protein ACR2F6_18960 [Mycobacteriales bacterium]